MIPWYLIPGRPYPLQVYEYACGYYSSNPNIGQRGAATATRAKFRLHKFSHSTVSRSFKTFGDAQATVLKKRFGEEIKVSGSESLIIVACAPKPAVDAQTASNSDAVDEAKSKNRFPSVSDTAGRRTVIANFLPQLSNIAKTAEIEAVVCQFAKEWHEISGRLLL